MRLFEIDRGNCYLNNFLWVKSIFVKEFPDYHLIDECVSISLNDFFVYRPFSDFYLLIYEFWVFQLFRLLLQLFGFRFHIPLVSWAFHRFLRWFLRTSFLRFFGSWWFLNNIKRTFTFTVADSFRFQIFNVRSRLFLGSIHSVRRVDLDSLTWFLVVLDDLFVFVAIIGEFLDLVRWLDLFVIAFSFCGNRFAHFI